MSEIASNIDATESESFAAENFKEIKPADNTPLEKIKEFWNNIFKNQDEIDDNGEGSEYGEVENTLEKVLNEYFNDLRDKSEYPETIPEKPFEVTDLKKLSPEENAKMRDEFDDKKAELKRQWEEVNGCSWPKYEHDVYSSNGKLIRRAGSDFDAHHIQPLSMGGKNEVKNIAPLNAEVHYDKQGVHASDSPYSQLDKILGGME